MNISQLRYGFFDPQKPLGWIAIALIIKLLLSLYLYAIGHHNGDMYAGYWFSISGDTQWYVNSVENLYQKGIYAYYTDHQGHLEPYSGRMPGLAAVYLLFRGWLSQGNTLNAMVFFQIFWDAVACYALGRIAFHLIGKRWAFFAGFSIYAVSSFISLANITIMTESLAMSFFVIGAYFLTKPQPRNIHYLGAGLFLGWMIFLRVFALPIWLLGGAWLLYKYRSKAVLWYFLPFLVADSGWIIRNYLNEKRIIYGQSDVFAGYKFPACRLALMQWVQAFGGDIVWWNPNSEISAIFRPDDLKKLTFKYPTVYDLPEYSFCSYYNADSLADWQADYQAIDRDQAGNIRTPLDLSLAQRAENYRQHYIAERPFQHYILAYPRILKTLLIHGGTTNFSRIPFSQMDIVNKGLKVFYSLMYWVFIPLGLMVACYLMVRIIFQQRLWSEGITFFVLQNVGILVLFLFLRFAEYRYLVIFYPSGIVIMIYALDRIRGRLGLKST